MSAQWRSVKLGDVLTAPNRAEVVLPTKEYRLLGVRLEGRGPFIRETVTGAQSSASKFFEVKSGDFIYSRLFACRGAFGVVGESMDGCFVSSEFPVFQPLADRVDVQFLRYWFTLPSVIARVDEDCTGSTPLTRNRFKERFFLSLEIPLPPLAEQRRIVARIESLAGHVVEARLLRNRATAEANALTSANVGKRFEALSTAYPIVPLEELTTHILDGPHITPNYLPEAVPGIPFVTVKNMVSGRLDFTGLRYVSEEDHLIFTRRCKPERGDVLYSKDGATRGRPCLVDTDREFSYFVSVALIKPIREQLDGRFLCHLLNSNRIKDRMATKSRGDMIQHIVLREIRAFPVPLPSLSEQHEIVAELDALKRLQSETAAELDALLPAILDRAFKGELD